MSKLTRLSLIALLSLITILSIMAQKDTLPQPERIVAIGDVHGDLAALTQVLTSAGLVDAKGKWTGGKTQLVQIGDLPDRGPDTRKAIELLMNLEKQAKKAGGAVHVLIGNHDAMNVYGDLRYTTAKEFEAFKTSKSEDLRDQVLKMQIEQAKPADEAAFKAKFIKDTPLGWIEHRQNWQPEGEIGKWTVSHNAVLKVGDTLFVHAGISPKYAAMPIKEINSTVRMELQNPMKLQGGVVQDELGPLWWRGMANGDETELTPHVDAVLKNFGVARVVIGHTPTKQTIRPRFGGKVINIDVGLSQAYGGPKDCLVIEGGKVFTMPGGTKTPLE